MQPEITSPENAVMQSSTAEIKPPEMLDLQTILQNPRFPELARQHNVLNANSWPIKLTLATNNPSTTMAVTCTFLSFLDAMRVISHEELHEYTKSLSITNSALQNKISLHFQIGTQEYYAEIQECSKRSPLSDNKKYDALELFAVSSANREFLELLTLFVWDIPNNDIAQCFYGRNGYCNMLTQDLKNKTSNSKEKEIILRNIEMVKEGKHIDIIYFLSDIYLSFATSEFHPKAKTFPEYLKYSILAIRESLQQFFINCDPLTKTRSLTALQSLITAISSAQSASTLTFEEIKNKEEQILTAYNKCCSDSSQAPIRDLLKILDDGLAPQILFNLMLEKKIDFTNEQQINKMIASRLLDVFFNPSLLPFIAPILSIACHYYNHPLCCLFRALPNISQKIIDYLHTKAIISTEQKTLYQAKISEIPPHQEISLETFRSTPEHTGLESLIMFHNVLGKEEGWLDSSKKYDTSDAENYILNIFRNALEFLESFKMVSQFDRIRYLENDTLPLTIKKISSKSTQPHYKKTEIETVTEINIRIGNQEYCGTITMKVELDKHGLKIIDSKTSNQQLLELLCALPWGNDPSIQQLFYGEYAQSVQSLSQNKSCNLVHENMRRSISGTHQDIIYFLVDFRLASALYESKLEKSNPESYQQVNAIRSHLQNLFATSDPAKREQIISNLNNLFYFVTQHNKYGIREMYEQYSLTLAEEPKQPTQPLAPAPASAPITKENSSFAPLSTLGKNLTNIFNLWKRALDSSDQSTQPQPAPALQDSISGKP